MDDNISSLGHHLLDVAKKQTVRHVPQAIHQAKKDVVGKGKEESTLGSGYIGGYVVYIMLCLYGGGLHTEHWAYWAISWKPLMRTNDKDSTRYEVKGQEKDVWKEASALQGAHFSNAVYRKIRRGRLFVPNSFKWAIATFGAF